MKNNFPQILAPVNALGEVEPLLEAGAHWLYGGVIPQEWSDRFPPTVLLNQRTFASAQFSSLAELEAGVLKTGENGGAFALTLNAPFYMDEQMPAALELARWSYDTGVSALIVSDPGFISCLQEEGNRLPLHLSTMGVAANACSVALYKGLGISRVVLPRFLNLDQIGILRASSPSMEFEAFALVGKCPNIEGLCTFVHDSRDRRWPCEWKWDLAGSDGGPPSESVAGYFSGIRGSDRRNGCGLCALPALVAAGISTFKIVGRGGPLERKVRLVSQLKLLLDAVPSKVDSGWINRCREIYHALYGRQCSGFNCYYPDILSAAPGSGS